MAHFSHQPHSFDIPLLLSSVKILFFTVQSRPRAEGLFCASLDRIVKSIRLYLKGFKPKQDIYLQVEKLIPTLVNAVVVPVSVSVRVKRFLFKPLFIRAIVAEDGFPLSTHKAPQFHT